MKKINHSSQRTAVAYLTNSGFPDVLERFLRLYMQSSSRASVYILLDVTNKKLLAEWSLFLSNSGLDESLIIPFSVRELESQLKYKVMSAGRLTPGSAHFPLICLAQQTQYQYYWLVEDDVEYNGNWGDLIGDLEHDGSDLLCSHVCSYKQRPGWYFWQSLEVPEADLVDQLRLIATKAFFPIYRISSRAIRAVDDLQRMGWRGHCEVIIPTILKYRGLSVGDLNQQSGTLLYTPGVISPIDGDGIPSSLRYRPVISADEAVTFPQFILIHPVKARSQPTKRSLTWRFQIWGLGKWRKVGAFFCRKKHWTVFGIKHRTSCGS